MQYTGTICGLILLPVPNTGSTIRSLLYSSRRRIPHCLPHFAFLVGVSRRASHICLIYYCVWHEYAWVGVGLVYASCPSKPSAVWVGFGMEESYLPMAIPMRG
jgi:hypothetical protein